MELAVSEAISTIMVAVPITAIMVSEPISTITVAVPITAIMVPIAATGVVVVVWPSLPISRHPEIAPVRLRPISVNPTVVRTGARGPLVYIGRDWRVRSAVASNVDTD